MGRIWLHRSVVNRAPDEFANSILESDGILLVDAGTVWRDDVEAARLRLKVLEECRVLWLEEPFVSGALQEYRELAAHAGSVKLAGGEGCHNYYMARQMIDHAGLGYIQIDAGRIGGITVARQVARYARSRGVPYVNHTFTSHLALSASLQPFAGHEHDVICEYPVEAQSLALELTHEHLSVDPDGRIRLPEAPGLGMTPDLQAVAKYLLDVEIRVGDRVIYQTPPLPAQP
jgi:L-alanine-DL-glutamate epimerase-like enolase superfamily enzyme